jgi:hypothetical protein
MITYAARRRLDIPPGFREPGELVPEAHDWFRLESWLHTGYIVEVEVSEEDFRAAVAQYAPDNSEAILEKAGLADGVVLEGPHKTPRRYTAKPTKAPVALKAE